MKNQQKWLCEICGYTYTAALPAFEVMCKQRHMPAKGQPNRGQMILVEGSLPKRKKESVSGNKQDRRA